MPNQAPIPPEAPKPADVGVEKPKAEKENFEAVEKQAEVASAEEEKLVDQLAVLRSKMAATSQQPAAAGQGTALATDIEEKKEKIISNFVAAARAANFDIAKVERIMHIAERYLRKDYPDIADEIHDRISNDRNI